MKTLKIVIIGESNVGKSSLLSQYIEQHITGYHESTIGTDFRLKTVDKDKEPVKLQLWDTAGQERFRTMVRMYYKNAKGVILVYDITNKISFQQLPYWIEEIDKYCEEVKRSEIFLVGNKTDLEAYRQVSHDEGEEFAKDYGINFTELSARNFEEVSELFARMVNSLEPSPSPKRGNLNSNAISSKKKCCF